MRGSEGELSLLLLPAHDIVGALQDIRITIATNTSHSCDRCSFSNWWRTSSASGLTGVLSVQIASVFMIIRRGRTTSSKVTILACVGVFRLAQCRINGGARGAAAPGPAVFRARNWCEWNIFMCCILLKLVKSRLLQQLSRNRNIFKLVLKLLRLYAAKVNWKQKSENSSP